MEIAFLLKWCLYIIYELITEEARLECVSNLIDLDASA